MNFEDLEKSHPALCEKMLELKTQNEENKMGPRELTWEFIKLFAEADVNFLPLDFQ